jgi:hypothetical protein
MNKGLSRRDLLVSLTASSLALATGCATFRSESEIDAAFNDLEALLQRVDHDANDRAVLIAERMKTGSLALLDTHEAFVTGFNHRAADRSVTKQDLDDFVDGYLETRKSQRDELLRLQDELHAALPPYAWPEVVEVLNRRSRAVKAGTV